MTRRKIGYFFNPNPQFRDLLHRNVLSKEIHKVQYNVSLKNCFSNFYGLRYFSYKSVVCVFLNASPKRQCKNVKKGDCKATV